MFLHLGKDVVVPLNNIIAIIDASSILKSKDGRAFLKIAEDEGFIYNISEEDTKSFIITEEVQIRKNGTEKIIKTKIYNSPISSATLYKRAKSGGWMYGYNR